MPQDCYFFFDAEKNKDIPEEQHRLSILCVPCRDQYNPGVGWFWNGSREGYGPWNYICCRCGINVNPNGEKEATNSGRNNE